MNTEAAHLNHDTHNPASERTLREWADLTGRKPDSLMKTIRRKLGTGHNLDTPMSADQFAALFQKAATMSAPKTRTTNPEQRTPQSQIPKPKSQNRQPSATLSPANRRRILYILMAMPAMASIQNMYGVSTDIVAHQSTAILFTGLFSAAPFMFVMAGMRSNWTRLITGLMIAYEGFANTTRIYGGLTGFGHSGFPTRFLGLVTDIFAYGKTYDQAGYFTGYQYQAGTHETAVILALLMAALAGGTFYTAYYELTSPAAK